MENLTLETLPKAFVLLSNEVSEIKRLLLEKSNEQQSEGEQLLTITQAGELLNLSVATLYGYVHRSEIPVCKRGKRLYFPKQSLIEWVKEGRKKTTAELNNQAHTFVKIKGGKQ